LRRYVFAQVVPEVLEHVPDGVRGLPHRLQDVRVIAVREHLPRPPSEAVQGARQTNRKTLNGARERAWLLAFDNQVQVIALDRVVHDAHPKAVIHRSQRVLDRASAAERAEEAHAGQQPHRHVHRVRCRESGPAKVRDPCLRRVRLAACAFALAAPTLELQCQLFHSP